MPLACAMEILITTADSLDDLPCLDNVDSRRGKPANHKVFSEATSVLACQALLSFAIDLIATRTKNVSPGHLLRVIADICFKGKEVSLSEVESVHRKKCDKILEKSDEGGALFEGGMKKRLRGHTMWDDTSDMEKDSRDDKATYVNVVGMDGAKKYAMDLVVEANQELAYFDSTRAAPSCHMANIVVSRRN
ncbi:hypothetical protein CICLE_v10013791mg [Citrus x clementina]|uniref:Uncharacterized protein n=1 Tax=Citrus clementina TaxID=85681 RepID=V4T2V0_CITCL|nr:hypothetical protein CICLE_v10013791mg [Citrus x clementina]